MDNHFFTFTQDTPDTQLFHLFSARFTMPSVGVAVI